jgi:hypothetical protein
MIMGKQNGNGNEFFKFQSIKHREESLKIDISVYHCLLVCSYVLVPAAKLNWCCRIAYQVWNSLDL